MLSRIRMPYAAIRKALLDVDDVLLSVENLRSIRQYCPINDEVDQLLQYNGDRNLLGEAEKYFLEVFFHALIFKFTNFRYTIFLDYLKG